ncbi:YegP family protein [Pseudarthrobacter albicanus]|uniref:YegP family protein n=1 Tax=Pseudarthrobacter albicanus TaxID=2823873 RepID=UPI001BA55660|nr:YegP family protein [Pseudarthrobacter albicanus]
MTGTFELFTDDTMYFRFRLRAPDGTVVAISRPFSDKSAAVAGISAVREYAGMGLITDLCPEVPASGSSTWPPAAALNTTPVPAAGRISHPPQPTAGTHPPGTSRPAAPRRVSAARPNKVA